jgi:hypothetical protein
MRMLLCLLLLLGRTAFGGGISTNGNAAAFESVEIAWTATTNGWPQSLWVYQVRPQVFSDAVISNLMAIGAFTLKHRARTPSEYVSDPKAIFFGRQGVKYLGIYPTLGFIDYHDSSAQARMTEPVMGVPNEKETTLLGSKYLRLLEIDPSQLAAKPGTSNLDLHWEKGTREYLDKASGKPITETNNYGVLFLRRIDGFNVRGYGRGGGVRVSFGNNDKVANLQVCWRNLKRYELRNFPSPGQITHELKSGHIALHPLSDASGKGQRFSERPEKLEITKAVILYDGKYQDEPMDFVCPYAYCEATAYVGTNTIALWFEAVVSAR